MSTKKFPPWCPEELAIALKAPLKAGDKDGVMTAMEPRKAILKAKSPLPEDQFEKKYQESLDKLMGWRSKAGGLVMTCPCCFTAKIQSLLAKAGKEALS